MPTLKNHRAVIPVSVTLPASLSTNGSPPTNGGAAFAPACRGRSSWSGLLRISLVAVPVKAYAAVSSTSSSSRCHMLHAGCGQRIGYQKHCPRHGAVESAGIVRGYEYSRGQHVVVEPEELGKLRPARDKALVLKQFVAQAEVDPTFYADNSLHLLPNGPWQGIETDNSQKWSTGLRRSGVRTVRREPPPGQQRPKGRRPAPCCVGPANLMWTCEH